MGISHRRQWEIAGAERCLRFESLESRLLPTVNPLNTEFQVNSFTTDTQQNTDVGIDASGDFTVVWSSARQDGTAPNFNSGIFKQDYSSDGSKIGGEDKVNTYTTGDQVEPSIAMNASGNYAIAWRTNSPQPQIRMRVYSGGNGGAEFVVNTLTFNSLAFPSVAISDSGNIVVTWEGDAQNTPGNDLDVYARVIGSIDPEFLVNTLTTGNQKHASAAIANNGNFVIVWQSDDDDQDVFARRFSLSGSPRDAEEVVVTEAIDGIQFAPHVAMKQTDGDYVVVWDDDTAVADLIYGRYFDEQTTSFGDEFPVSVNQGDDQDPLVSFAGTDGFVVVWLDRPAQFVVVRDFDLDGNPAGGPIIVNDRPFTVPQARPSIAANSAHDAVAVWTADQVDFSSFAISGRQMTVLNPSTPGRELGLGGFENGLWYFDLNGDQSLGTDDISAFFGVNIDTPILGDWMGTRSQQLGVFRHSFWYLDTNGVKGWQSSDTSIQFGVNSDIPVAGNWRGEQILVGDRIGVFRDGVFYLDSNGALGWQSTDTALQFGGPGDIPVVGDWNGDSKDDVGVVRGSTWYLDSNGIPGWQNSDSTIVFGVGFPVDVPVVKDWDRDGFDNIGVYRRNGQWFIDSNRIPGWQGDDRSANYFVGLATPIVHDTVNVPLMLPPIIVPFSILQINGLDSITNTKPLVVSRIASESLNDSLDAVKPKLLTPVDLPTDGTPVVDEIPDATTLPGSESVDPIHEVEDDAEVVV